MGEPTVIDGFISRETALYLHELLKPMAVINPKGLPNVYLKNIKTNENQFTALQRDLIHNIERAVASEFNFKQSQVTLDRINYQILPLGRELGFHTDSYGENGLDMQPGGVEGYTDTYWSALLYLNDDYEGGEIIFFHDNSGEEEKSTPYKPKAGTLIYFKGDRHHPHAVKKVLTSERANIILFYDVNEAN